MALRAAGYNRFEGKLACERNCLPRTHNSNLRSHESCGRNDFSRQRRDARCPFHECLGCFPTGMKSGCGAFRLQQECSLFDTGACLGGKDDRGSKTGEQTARLIRSAKHKITTRCENHPARLFTYGQSTHRQITEAYVLLKNTIDVGFRQSHGLAPRNAGIVGLSTELEQYAISTAWIFPLDLAGLCGKHTAGPAFEATIHRDFHLALVIETVTTRRAGIGERAQRLRRSIVRANLDMRPPRIHKIAVLKELFFNLGAQNAGLYHACHRHDLASLNASPIRPGSDRPLRNDLRISFSFVSLSAPSTRNQVCAAALTSLG